MKYSNVNLIGISRSEGFYIPEMVRLLRAVVLPKTLKGSWLSLGASTKLSSSSVLSTPFSHPYSIDCNIARAVVILVGYTSTYYKNTEILNDFVKLTVSGFVYVFMEFVVCDWS